MMRLFVLGASGSVGSHLLAQAVARGHQVTAQTRTSGKIKETASVQVVTGLPTDKAFLRRNLVGQGVAILCIGIGSIGKTTLFSDTTRALVAAMQATGVKRLVVITGIGTGDTR